MLNLLNSQIDFDPFSEDELLDAVLISLYSNRKVDDSEIPEGHENQGFWGDQLDPNGLKVGSDLWILRREYMSEELAGKARQFIEDALQWLIDDGWAEEIRVIVQQEEDRLHPIVEIDKDIYNLGKFI